MIRRLLPSSLFGQVMASVAVALLVAQVVSALLLYRASEERRETAAITAVAFRLVGDAERAARRNAISLGSESQGDPEAIRRAARRAAREAQGRPPGPPDARRLLSGDRGGNQGGGPAGAVPDGLPRPLRYNVSDTAPPGFSDARQESDREQRLRTVLAQEGLDPVAVVVDYRRAGDDALLVHFAESRPRLANRTRWRERMLYVASIQRTPGAPWETARLIEAPRNPGALGVLLFQTLVTFGVLMIVLFLVLRRITRPLAQLTERVSTFSRQPDRAVRLEESGPADTRRLIAAHNKMEARVVAMLDEKDVMLGAIGHDLKTPLAALRVRIESVPDDTMREKMARSIEDITATLDDILALARVGRPDASDAENVDLRALAQSVAEEFEDLGEPITMIDPKSGDARVVARIQVTWIKRALRNLVSNALRYGGSAEVSVLPVKDTVILRVDDKGPGIPDDRIADMLEPFTRGEASRNRATGGAGLGLTLARAIAEQHGGELVLANRSEGGLRAEIRLPA